MHNVLKQPIAFPTTISKHRIDFFVSNFCIRFENFGVSGRVVKKRWRMLQMVVLRNTRVNALCGYHGLLFILDKLKIYSVGSQCLKVLILQPSSFFFYWFHIHCFGLQYPVPYNQELSKPPVSRLRSSLLFSRAVKLYSIPKSYWSNSQALYLQ